MSNVRRAALRVAETLGEAIADLGTRVNRVVVPTVVVSVGVAVLVAGTALSATARFSVLSRLDNVGFRTITVHAPQETDESDGAAIPWTAGSSLRKLNGVLHVGLMATIDVAAEVSRFSSVERSSSPAPLVAVDANTLSMAGVELRIGRIFDEGLHESGWPVAIVGSSAAERLGISLAAGPQLVEVAEIQLLVLGVITVTEPEFSELQGALIVPHATAMAYYGLDAPTRVVAQVDPALADGLSRRVPYAIDPIRGPEYVVSAPPSAPRADAGVARDLSRLLRIVAAATLSVAVVGISLTGYGSIRQRRGDIGLRRAMGASASAVAALYVLQMALLGAIGGAAGASAGATATVLISRSQGWEPVLDPQLLAVGFIVGLLSGVAGGTMPAIRAARIQPADALRDEG